MEPRVRERLRGLVLQVLVLGGPEDFKGSLKGIYKGFYKGAWRPSGLSKSVITGDIIGVTVLKRLVIAYLLSPLGLYTW